jgi:prepilin-type N-terminal cleavage/methylation domain-containing protein
MCRQRGFSLVELLFALLILSIVILTTLAMFAERDNRLRQAAGIVIAYQVLSNEAEVRRRVDVNSADFGGSTFLSDTSLLNALGPHETDVEVSDRKPGIREVKMIIRWEHRKKKNEASLTLMRTHTGGTNLW